MEDLERDFIGPLNDIALELGFYSDMMHHNGLKNKNINVSCRFCTNFRIQLDFEKVDEVAINITVKRMLHGWRHDGKEKHYV